MAKNDRKRYTQFKRSCQSAIYFLQLSAVYDYFLIDIHLSIQNFIHLKFA